MARFLFCGIMIAVAVQIAGCTGGADLAPLSASEEQSLAARSTASPQLQSGEKIRVNVFGEDKLSGDYEIDPSGFVSLPLAGAVQAAGLTPAELEIALTKKFQSEYLKNAKVTVTIAEFRPFYILGEVERPGEYPYKSGLNVLSATALAGGPTYRASRSTVLIQHPGEGGTREYPMSATVPILPGDLIRVPERFF
jgi:protein involved in polysaccharide export with SLBB domain